MDQGLNVSALADQMRGISTQDVRFTTVPLGNYDYHAPDGEVAVQWDQQAAGALFGKLKNDQNLAPTPAATPRTPPTVAPPRPGQPQPPRKPQEPQAPRAGSGTGSSTGNTAAQDACG